uniref:protein-serine/threonine phosphatase n=1 Tax=Arundo donax TaxID=35708 RepID=A0A0A9FLS4_ARUDO
MTSQAVVDFVHQHIRSGATDLRAICERLVDRCLSSKDNVTVILVQFKNTDSDRLPALIEPDIKGEESEQSEDDGGDNKKTPQESLVEEEADHEDDEEQALLRAEKAEE